MSSHWRSGQDDFAAVAARDARPAASMQRGDAPVGGAAKRVLDIGIAVVALLLCVPLLAFVVALIKCWDRGPIFYVHWRIGYEGRPFGCLKFRTMVPNGDEVLQSYLTASPAAAREWAETRKLKSDPRVTTLGTILRKSSLDELPQLINVLRGDMSLVGPRPIVPAEAGMYGQELGAYLRSRPGLTGAWQVSGRNNESYARRVAMDRNYVEHWSLWRDIVIMARTVPVLLTTRGSY
jgi:exopolysaccharide production protein ExoY